MNTIRCFAVLFALTCLTTSAFGDSPSEDNPVRVILDLSDGSRVVGVPSVSSVRITTGFAEPDIPLEQISKIRMKPDNETAVIEFRNGDKLTGILELAEFEITTLFGEQSISTHLVRAVSVQTGATGLKGTGYALRFDGHYNNVKVPGLLYSGSHPITVEAIAAPDSFDNEGVVVGDTEFAGIGLDCFQGHWAFEAHNGSRYLRVESAEQTAPHELVHVAGVFDLERISLFVNGKLQGSVPLEAGSFNPSGMPLTIGAGPPGPVPEAPGCDWPFKGVVDAVRVSNTVRYAQDFDPPSRLTSDSDTILLLQFDEGEGTVAHDESQSGYDGILDGPEWVLPTGQPSSDSL